MLPPGFEPGIIGL